MEDELLEEEKNEKRQRITIDCHPELIEILNKLEPKIKEVTWGAIEKVSYYTKTLILARKLKALKVKI